MCFSVSILKKESSSHPPDIFVVSLDALLWKVIKEIPSLCSFGFKLKRGKIHDFKHANELWLTMEMSLIVIKKINESLDSPNIYANIDTNIYICVYVCVIYSIYRNVIYITWRHWDRNSRPFQKFQHHRDITAFISRRPSVPPPWDLSPTVFIPIWFILLFSLQNNRSYLTPYSLPLMRYGIDACIWDGWGSRAEGVENAF